jgi:hypothetical protein
LIELGAIRFASLSVRSVMDEPERSGGEFIGVEQVCTGVRLCSAGLALVGALRCAAPRAARFRVSDVGLIGRYCTVFQPSD